MNGDRLSCLLRRLYATGQLAKLPGDARSPYWWQRVMWLIQEQVHQDQWQLNSVLYLRNASLRTIENLTPESLRSLQSDADHIYERLQDSLRPWRVSDKARQGRRGDDAESMEIWKRNWGDPNDPEVQKRIEATAAAIMAGAQGRR